MKKTNNGAAKTSANKTNTTSANATSATRGNKASQPAPAPAADTTPAPAPTTPQGQPAPAAAVTGNASTDTTANKDGGKVFTAFDAATIASTAAAWLETYASIRGIKDNAATLIGQHGKDNFKAVLAACKASRAAGISAMHASTAAAWSYSAVLQRQYDAIKDGADWRNWCGMISANWPTAADFVAACYPHTLEDGRPAVAVDYTNGQSIYRAYRPIRWKDGKDGAGAMVILRAALDNLEKRHKAAADKGKDGGALVCTSKHKDGRAVAVYGVKLVDKESKDGRQYRQAAKADKGAPLAVAVSVLSAGKDGGRLLTLAEYNADLKESTSKASK